jgi:cation:H+ antiporter
VNGAKEIAHLLGVSEAVIGLTIVAGGTSLPELATSVVSAYKGQSGIAIGNVLGSNVFNILMILGVTGIITPLEIHGISYVDYGVMALSMLLLWSFSYTKFKIERWEGFVLLAIFFAYMAWLITNAF